jgi:superkiller protein 3
MAERVVKSHPALAWNRHALGLVLYRQGKYRQAVQEFRTSLQINPRWVGGCLNQCLLAMSYHRLGQTAEARLALTAASQKMDEWLQALLTPGKGVTPGLLWAEWLECLLNYREAKTLVEGKPPAEDPRLLLIRARGLAAIGAKDQAGKACDRGLPLRPGDPFLHQAGFLVFRELGQWNKAHREYSHLNRWRPKVFRIELESFADCALRADWDQAQAEYTGLVKRHPKAQPLRIAAGHLYFQQGQWDRALMAYRQGSDLKTDRAGSPEQLAASLRRQGILAQAIAAHRDAHRCDFSRVQALDELAFGLTRIAALDEAISAYQDVLRLNPDSFSAHFELGRIYLAKDQWDPSIAAWKEARRLRPNDVETHYGLALALESRGFLKEAEAEHRRVLDLMPHHQRAHFGLAFTLHRQGREDEAIAEYKKAIRLDPKDVSAHYNLGLSLYDRQRWDESIASYKTALHLNPNHALAHYNLGLVYFHQERWDDVIAENRAALRLQPDDAWAHVNLGLALKSKGLLDKAMGQFQEAIRLIPDDAYPHYCMANVLLLKGREHEAFAEYHKAMEARLKLSDAAVNDYLAWQFATYKNPKYRDPKRAVEAANRAVKLAPLMGSPWTTLGVAHYRAGDWKAALQALEKSMKLQGGDNANTFFFLAMTHWRLGNKGKAVEWYNRASDWMKKNQPQDEELGRFHAEAAALLEIQLVSIRPSMALGRPFPHRDSLS